MSRLTSTISTSLLLVMSQGCTCASGSADVDLRGFEMSKGEWREIQGSNDFATLNSFRETRVNVDLRRVVLDHSTSLGFRNPVIVKERERGDDRFLLIKDMEGVGSDYIIYRSRGSVITWDYFPLY